MEPQRRPWNTHQTIAPYLNQLAKKRASQNNTSSVSTRNSQSNVNNNNMSDPKRQDTSLDHEDAELKTIFFSGVTFKNNFNLKIVSGDQHLIFES